MKEILYNGSYTINNKPIILKVWTTDFSLEKAFLTSIPLWVKFSNLPMTCWSKGSLSRIACAVGKPIYADKRTTNQTRISFARMLIEVNITNPLPNEIIIKEPNGKQIKQVIIYDWKPKYCPKCSMVGHYCPPRNQGQGNVDRKQQQPKNVMQE